MEEVNEKAQLAASFINSTHAHVFLTGKAGSGKTTFLRNLSKNTHKRFVVVAPTGIAALNAQGVTIHSQFLLPPGSYLPDFTQSKDRNYNSPIFYRNDLNARHPLNTVRKRVLQNIDLLIIDEVSMLRADLLDAIDFRLKSARNNFRESFGGVQVLFIGDLFQLSPIVRENEWPVLSGYYKSMYFYDALCLRDNPPIYIELEKIYRQRDGKFISLLNNLRDNTCTAEDLELLNSYYTEKPKASAITLTTHNRIANEINERKLEQLAGKSYTYEAEIEGDYPKGMYPTEPEITLKKGTRVMFIKNDNQDQVYYNGKTATVVDLDSSKIKVKFDDEDTPYTLQKALWENKKYLHDPDTNELKEEVVGSYSHYPIKLAWAITVHKSQGLTFDEAVVDLGQAFAPGQVYVALSRLRSLDGLQLRSKLSPKQILCHDQVERFVKNSRNDEALQQKLSEQQERYIDYLLGSSYNLDSLINQAKNFASKTEKKHNFEIDSLNLYPKSINQTLGKNQPHAQTFAQQLVGLYRRGKKDELKQRLYDGSKYFEKVLRDLVFETLNQLATVQEYKGNKAYCTLLEQMEASLLEKWHQVAQIPVLMDAILAGSPVERDKTVERGITSQRQEMINTLGAKIKVETANKTGKKKTKKAKGEKKPKAEKGATYATTLGLLLEGKNIEEVAEERGLAASTIEGHAVKLIREKKIEINRFLEKEMVAEISKALDEVGKESIKPVVAELNEKYSYGQVRMVQAFFQSLN
ncbi:helix-turn-helix domain-containing protein [Luteibaculum oceani]|uniref:AAA family ATPase n=1 Tax=Luteibaculum oceani TaxID=1294296 RepID=A0A5C6VJG3_9FLAO|nr:helix-turn-helix domain-containing protein [Luteibaculum oceani]TXC85447.1 AAA family ATPase [Luteibaculum oceani]